MKSHLDSAAWVLPGELKRDEKLRSLHNEDLAAISGKVNVRFIAVLSPFHRTQRPV